ncbi:RNA-directed DNA polymerase, eukaryota [Tanacetum coccineum]|uniref:RNA-directed DNA polymerase, eukaryota n=1 Tax=Tanacetum coccineum TaxID=301880 RepID=A0ABQ5I6L1_9ASTR
MGDLGETEFSAKYPPGFTPKEDSANNSANCGTAKVENNMETNKDADTNEFCVNQSESNLKEDGAESTFSGYFKKSKGPRSGGSILNLLEDVVKVGHVMGYNMEGCVSNMEEIIKSQGAGEVNILALQETKMENMSLLCVKSCWGNMTFDFVHSDSVGNPGGILCVWDPNAFRKNSVTLSDYFILVRGVWEQNGMDLLIVVVYAPHDAKEKIMLWDYLASEINRWRGKVVVMGDFNKVRFRSDRFGSIFNAKGANVFNSFISNAGLVEVELGGCSFTWCHKTAKKMSKLDRFLVSDNLLHTYPHLSAISLERFLSDHRPILLREHHLDYGPTPFRFFHYWCEIDGFKNLVEDAWKDSPNNEGNAMLNLMGNMRLMRNGYEEIVAKAREAGENLQILTLNVDGDGTKDEIKRAVWDCGTDKSPGPDGFTFGFYRRFWYLIENDVYKAVSYFFLFGDIPKGCNSSFIVLIPKFPGANMVKDFRPISLIGSLYKIIAKVLANRLVDKLGSIVNEVQSAFVKDRQILDGPFILDELIQWCKKKRKHLLCSKLYFEKACDS